MVKNLPANAEDMDSRSLGWEDALEKEMTAHSSILLAWKIPWTEEPGWLHPRGGRKESDLTEHSTRAHTILSSQILHQYPKTFFLENENFLKSRDWASY